MIVMFFGYSSTFMTIEVKSKKFDNLDFSGKIFPDLKEKVA